MKHYAKLLVASALVCAPLFAATAAGAATLTDSYSGGYAPPSSTGSDNQNATTGTDIVGNNTFQINSLSAYRTANGNNPWGTLNIVITTFYAGMPEVGASGPALGTGYGDLFITPGKNAWNPNTQGSCGDCDDVYKPGEWAYVATMATDPTLPANHVAGSFYSTAGNSQISGSTVGTTTGTINPNGTGTGAYASLGTSSFGTGPGVVTSDYGAAPGYTSCDGENTTTNCNVYRADQAVGYDPTTNQQTVAGISENYTVTPSSGCTNIGTTSETCTTAGTITFQIIDNGALGNNFALSWAMTCANDVIQGQVSLGAGDDPVDEPPTLAIVLAGLLSIVGYRRWAKHKDPSLMQYA